ncbi:MAG: exodeoxyribonuclease VII small subunit [Prevotella sp.]|jgi:exodeoxyribonuclease VII small subunit|nr:exodeoxyribonuclease VII small subunit [Prevotella sp.]
MKYEEEVKRLEQIVQQMERGDLDIDQLTEQLKEAQRIIKSCKAKLTKTDAEIKQLLEG